MARSWGQIRLELSKSLPGVDIELLTGWIQSSYQAILESRPWGGLRARTTIVCPMALGQDGTSVDCVQGSDVVTAVDTTWGEEQDGWSFSAAESPAIYLASYVDPTHLSLDRPFEGESVTGSGYQLAQLFYTLPDDCKYIEQCVNPYRALPMTRKTRADLEEMAVQGLYTGVPAFFAPDDDTIEDSPQIFHTIRFWPAAGLTPVGITVTYQRTTEGFDGTNTAKYPLPWISDDAILYGAKAMALDQAGNYNGGLKADSRADQYLKQTRAAESEREGASRLRMASRFTRHRLKRWR